MDDRDGRNGPDDRDGRNGGLTRMCRICRMTAGNGR